MMLSTLQTWPIVRASLPLTLHVTAFGVEKICLVNFFET
jgi:hypothetical protein